MTKRELIERLAEFPDDAPVFDGRGYDLKPHSITSMNYDVWEGAEKDEEGFETPGVGVGISIGSRF